MTRCAKETGAILRTCKIAGGRGDSELEITVAEKPGSLNGAQCDTGLVLLPRRPYVISVVTTFNADTGNPGITGVSARAFSYFNRLAHANAYGVDVR